MSKIEDGGPAFPVPGLQNDADFNNTTLRQYAAIKMEAYCAMVDRFLSWKLPQDFGPDAGISFTPPPHLPDLYWPTGTNLFHAGQALEMFKHCVELSSAVAVRLAEKNLFDAQEAAKTITKQAIAAEAARDALAAKLAELEGQEPVVKYSGKRLTPEGTKEMWGYLLSEVEPRENQELYARPVPAEEGIVTVTTNDAGRCVMVSRQDEDHRILSVIWEAKDVPTEPVNARLLDALKLAECVYRKNVVNEGEPSSVLEAMQAAIAAAEARQERLLQDMHDAGLEIDRVMAEPAPEAVRLTDYSSTVDRAWARFCGAFGDGPDAPYPGMIAAFETHYGQSFRDKEWRTEATCWAAAWSKATARADAKNDSYRS